MNSSVLLLSSDDDDDFSSLPVDPLYEKEKNPMKQSQILTPN